MRLKKVAIWALVATVLLGCYVGSFFFVRRPVALTRIADRPASNYVGDIFVTTQTYHFSKNDKLNLWLYCIYWPLEEVCGSDSRSLMDRLSEPADRKHNGRLPTYVRDLNELRAIAAEGFPVR
jgi:hypothetical protein